MVEGNGAAPIDEIKVRTVIAVCDELRALSPDDPQYVVVLRRVEEHWRSLSLVEQDKVNRIFDQRGFTLLK